MSFQADKPTSPASSPEPQTAKISKGLACIFCQQRKIKCNRERPCESCTKARVACTYRARQAPRRRHTKATEVSLRARLSRLEDLLKTAVSRNENAENDDLSPESSTAPPPSEDVDTVHMQLRNSLNIADQPEESTDAEPQRVPGQLVAGHGKSRYIENKLWNKIYEQLKDTQELLDEESSDEEGRSAPRIDQLADPTQADLTFGTSVAASSLQTLHPHPSHIIALWTAFAENVNPLTRIIHVPSAQRLVLEVSQNIDSLSKGATALFFAIYFAAVTSLTDDDCVEQFGEPKSALQARYKYTTQKALLNANYLRSSDLMVLQAFVIYLLAARPFYDTRTFWAVSGLAVRMAQRIGIHRDGAKYGLNPFEVEMRRRLWWQIMFIDVRAAEVCGAGLTTVTLGDTKRPLNINDDDLQPGMLEAPKEREGPTEMCFVMLRSSLGRYFKFLYKSHFSPDSQLDLILQVEQQERRTFKEILEEFEEYLHDNFLKNADPLDSLQFFTSMVARAILCSWRVMNCIRRAADKDASGEDKQEGRDRLFEESLRGIEYDNLGHTTKSTQRFLWHIATHFQWHSFIALLGELRVRTSGDMVDRAWRQVGQVYEHHPEMLRTRNPLHTAVGNLTVAAWEAREADFARAYGRGVVAPPESPPDYMNVLRRQRIARARSIDKSATSTSDSPRMTPSSDGLASTLGSGPYAYTSNFASLSGGADPSFDVPAFSSNLGEFPPTMAPGTSMPLDSNQMDWNVWDSLLQNYELPAPGESADFGSGDGAYGGLFR